MDCFEARRGLWPPERPRLASGGVTEARAHVEECSECADYFAQDRALLEAYDRIRGTSAPQRVRERVFDVLARARAGEPPLPPTSAVQGSRWRRWGPLLATAAVFFIGLGSTTWLTRSSVSVEAGGSMFVEDYLRRAVGADHIETSDPAEVTRFLARELGLALAPISNGDLVLERAEICLLEGRRGAMIVYKRDGEVISHYVVPSPGSEVRAPKPGKQLERSGGTPSVITWSTPELEQALVGEISVDELIELARSASSLD